MVFGNNGIIKKAQDARSTYALAELEEEANLEYTSLKIDDYVSDNNVTIGDRINKLRTKYQIKKVNVSGEITGISVNSDTLTLGKNATTDIEVTLEGNSEGRSRILCISRWNIS